MSRIKRMVLTAMLISVGIVLPMVFHIVPAGFAGRVLLPMHIPVLVAGLVVGPFYGFFAGLVTPLLSSMTTSMPAPGVTLYRMMVELSVYGAAAGFAMRYIRTRRLIADLYISLITAMVLGRVAAGFAQAVLLFGGGTFAVGVWVAGYFTTSLAGIVLQLIFIPTIIITLERGGLIPARYKTTKKEGMQEWQSN
ncbi:MAG: ECF transporter S component [Defluviitaleaceae bacterium]|nr:ECF transporter S component [Defluviitaleaceae bacterium]MCL2276185.1 ECF transporter S component [Defluviitaleaceae bacterium]